MTVHPLARYKAAFAAMILAVPAAGHAERVAGATLPDGAKQVGEHRYRVDKNYEETLKYFRAVYPPAKYPRQLIANQPGIKAVHIENPEAKPGSWDGLNVYELDGETRVFVLVGGSPEKNQKQQQRKK